MHLKFILVLLFLIGNIAPLSAQDFRLQMDAGVAGLRENQSVGPAASLGGEFMFTLSPKTLLTAGFDFAYVGLTAESPGIPPNVIPGQFPITFERTETYRLRRTEVGLSIGAEQDIGRLRVQLLGRLSHYLVNNITYTRRLDFFGPDRPDNSITVKVTEGELFEQDIQTMRIDLSTDYQIQAGLSVRYKLGKDFEVGLTGLRTLNTVLLEQYVTRYCANCPELDEPSRVQTSAAATWQLQMSTRYYF